MKYSVGALLLAASAAVAAPTGLEAKYDGALVHDAEWPDADDRANTINRMSNAPSADCKPITVIFARGTMEPSPAPGLLTGYPFVQALKAKYGGSKVDVQAVQYGASIAGYLEGGDPKGAQAMAQMIKKEVQACPKTSILMGGYSQGGQVVHKAAALLDASDAKHIKAVVIFGDPDKGKHMKNINGGIVDTVCDEKDLICKGLPVPLGTHLQYSKYAKQAADWVFKTLGPSGKGKGSSDSSDMGDMDMPAKSKPKSKPKPKAAPAPAQDAGDDSSPDDN
jgi:hypothetical protein